MFEYNTRESNTRLELFKNVEQSGVLAWFTDKYTLSGNPDLINLHYPISEKRYGYHEFIEIILNILSVYIYRFFWFVFTTTKEPLNVRSQRSQNTRVPLHLRTVKHLIISLSSSDLFPGFMELTYGLRPQIIGSNCNTNISESHHNSGSRELT